MSPKKRQDRFFGGDSGRGGKATPESGASSSGEFEIVDSEGRVPRSDQASAAETSGMGAKSLAKGASTKRETPDGSPRGGGKRKASASGGEEAVPYIAPHGPRRRSSLGWAWLTIVVTLLLAVGSYWFYEGFGGDVERVRERFETFRHRLFPEDRMASLDSSKPSGPSAMAPGVDPSAPLPVVTDSGTRDERLSRPDSVIGQREFPSNEPDATEPEAMTLEGVPSGETSQTTDETTERPGVELPTRPRPTSPTRREPPSQAVAEDEGGGWYRTEPSLSMDNAPPDVVAANAPDVTPRPLIRATPEPQMTPFADRVVGPEEREAAPPAPRPTRRTPPPSGSSGSPSVALPTELSTFRESPTPTPTPTPSPTPVRPSDAGMTQMSVGRVTAGATLVDLGLVYASRTLAELHRNFNSPSGEGEGSARISFNIRRDGAVSGITLVRSSGSQERDNAAIRAIGRSRLRPLSGDIEEDPVRVEVVFDF